MKKITSLLTVLCVSALLLSQSGCATTPATPESKAANIQKAAYAAASIGAAIALNENEGLWPQFQLAYDNLNTLVESKVVSGLLLRTVLDSLPVKELKSPNARIVIEGVVYLYTTTVGDQLNLENAPYALAAATGIRDGLKVALGR